MGALAYVAIVSGLFIFGAAAGLESNPENARPQLLWLAAFLGGFSDKFFETVINVVVGKISGQNEQNKEQTTSNKPKAG